MRHTVTRAELEPYMATLRVSLASAAVNASMGCSRKRMEMTFQGPYIVTVDKREVYSGSSLDEAIAAYNAE